MTFNEAVERFKTLKNKPSFYDSMYEGVKEKFNRMNTEVSLSYIKYISNLNTYSNGMVRFGNDNTYISFYVNGEKHNAETYSLSTVVDKAKDPDSLREYMTETLMYGFGVFFYNYGRRLKMTPMDTMNISICISNIISNITDTFISGILRIEEENKRKMESIRKFNEAGYNRQYSVDRAWNEMVSLWKKEKGLSKGTDLYVSTGSRWNRFRKFDHIRNEKTVYFTDGTRTNVDNIDFEYSFRRDSGIERY